MKVSYLDVATDDLADPLAVGWSTIDAETVQLDGTSIADQPSRYLRSAYTDDDVGAVHEVDVQVAESGSDLLIRLSWADENEDLAHQDRSFPDAAAAMFPLRGDAPLESMGAEDRPVALWYWRPDLDAEADELVARGLGTVEPIAPGGNDPLSARSCHSDGRWAVVLRRSAAASAADRADLTSTGTPQMALAVWEGSAGERGGLKSTSLHWHHLDRVGESA